MDILNRIIRVLDKVGMFSRWTNVIGVAGFFTMICLTFVDVIMRYVFNSPMRYVTELVEVMMITAVFLGITHTQNEKAHVSIDLFSPRLKPRGRAIQESIVLLVGMGIFAVVIWQNIAEIFFVLANNVPHTQSLRVNKAPFLAIIVFGSTTLWLLLLRDLLRNMVEATKLGMRWLHWSMIAGISILFLVLSILWMQPTLWQMSLFTTGLIGIIFCLVLMLTSLPVAFVLILTGLLFVGHIRGSATAFDMIGADIYRTAGTYSWSALPFFVLMGFFTLVSQFGADLYHSASKWFGHLRGGLGMATVGACAVFSAIDGDSVASTATMSAVALPEMRKYKYDDRLSTGAITGGGNLGPIIPPSVLFIIYGLLTKVSTGDLFIAGIIPGIIMAIVFGAIIYVWCRINPNLGPPTQKSTWGPRIKSLTAIGPVVVLFLLVVGGIYTGVFTPTECGAIGTVGVVIFSLLLKRLSWNNFSRGLLDGGKVISTIFLIVIGAGMFTKFIAWCHLTESVTNIMLGIPIHFLVISVLIFFFIAGIFMDILPLTMIGVPIVHPIAVATGADPLWFAILLCMVINAGSLTPPIGINLFVIKSAQKDIPMSVIFAGALPFVYGSVFTVAILYALPSLITWLPSVLK